MSTQASKQFAMCDKGGGMVYLDTIRSTREEVMAVIAAEADPEFYEVAARVHSPWVVAR